MKTPFKVMMLLLLLLTLPAMVQAQFNYTINNGTITITGYTGSGGAVTIPSSILVNGITLPVTSIGDNTFQNNTSLTSVMIPNSVTNIGIFAFYECNGLTNVTIGTNITSIGSYAFSGCTGLSGVYFQGNAPAPANDCSVFLGDINATVYYLPGTTGWGTTIDCISTALWLPQVQTSDASFGVQTNQFGFNITWASGMIVVVEACTNMINPQWSPLSTNSLTNGSIYFSDPQWINYPTRFYRIRSP